MQLLKYKHRWKKRKAWHPRMLNEKSKLCGTDHRCQEGNAKVKPTINQKVQGNLEANITRLLDNRQKTLRSEVYFCSRVKIIIIREWFRWNNCYSRNFIIFCKWEMQYLKMKKSVFSIAQIIMLSRNIVSALQDFDASFHYTVRVTILQATFTSLHL